MNGFLMEGIGYLASAFLAVSLIMNNDLKFRWINAFGCFSFIIYGIFIHAFPIILTNLLLLCINVYYLFKIYKSTEDFDLVEFTGDEILIKKFLDFYHEDIQKYFPAYQALADNNLKFVVLRNLVIAAIFSGTLLPGGTVSVNLNYTVPKYRDYKVGRFIFTDKKNFLASRGVKEIFYEKVDHKGHRKFLERIGFSKVRSADKINFVKHL